MRLQSILFFAFLVLTLHIKEGELFAQEFPYPQSYPGTYPPPMRLGDPTEPTPAPPPITSAHIEHQRIIPPQTDYRRLLRPYRNNGWFYTRRTYDQALLESREEQRRLYQDAYPSSTRRGY